MNVHKNARLTPAGRALLIQRLEAGESPHRVAASLLISPRTVYKWQARWRAEGARGLADRSSRPHRIPRRLPRPRRRTIERLRRKGWSTPAIAQATGIPLSTVGDTVRRLGLSRWRLTPPAPVVRYQWARPGELLHMDIKMLGRIGRVGHRIHGDRRTRSRGIGWEFCHVVIDDASRVAYGEVLPDERAETVVGFFQRAVAWFTAQGVTVERVLTDNGNGYRSRVFRGTVRALGIRHLRTRPYTPRTNGKAERFIRTALENWAYRRPYRSSAERAASLAPFLTWYNQERRHSAIARQTPQQRLFELLGGHNLSGNHS